MKDKENVVGFNHKVVKGQTKEQFIKDHPHLDAKYLADEYDKIVPKEEKASKDK